MTYYDEEQDDTVLHCTGTVTDYELEAFKKRIASATTTIGDVKLLEELICYVTKQRITL